MPIQSNNEPKIITLDIETSPYAVYTWQLWDTSISNDQIIDDATILSCAVKVLGESKPYYNDTSEKRNVRNDRELVKWVHDWLEWADIVVTQNGKRFDIPRINARLAYYGLRPPKPFLHVDTCATAKKIFKFSSNKLEWLSKILTDEEKSKHREFPGFELWIECLKGNKKAWKVMQAYNEQDVVSTEKVYLKLRPWMPSHPNTALITGRPEACPACGGTHLQSRGWAYTQSSKYRQFQCTGCGKWTRSRQREKL